MTWNPVKRMEEAWLATSTPWGRVSVILFYEYTYFHIFKHIYMAFLPSTLCSNPPINVAAGAWMLCIQCTGPTLPNMCFLLAELYGLARLWNAAGSEAISTVCIDDFLSTGTWEMSFGIVLVAVAALVMEKVMTWLGKKQEVSLDDGRDIDAPLLPK
jgi:hypothetical protein